VVIKVDEKEVEAVGVFVTLGGLVPMVIDRQFVFMLRVVLAVQYSS